MPQPTSIPQNRVGEIADLDGVSRRSMGWPVGETAGLFRFVWLHISSRGFVVISVVPQLSRLIQMAQIRHAKPVERGRWNPIPAQRDGLCRKFIWEIMRVIRRLHLTAKGRVTPRGPLLWNLGRLDTSYLCGGDSDLTLTNLNFPPWDRDLAKMSEQPASRLHPES